MVPIMDLQALKNKILEANKKGVNCNPKTDAHD